MIEMRWFTTRREKLDRTEMREYSSLERVLQYRFMQDVWARDPSGEFPLQKISGWSEWRDVSEQSDL